MSTGFPLVLLAEDDDDMRHLIAARLTREGMAVVEVTDGTRLRDYLTVCRPGGAIPRPDVIISDIEMPGETGPGAIAKSNNAQSLPVVLITAAADVDLRALASQAGVVAVFEKPFAIKALLTAIRTAVVS